MPTKINEFYSIIQKQFLHQKRMFKEVTMLFVCVFSYNLCYIPLQQLDNTKGLTEFKVKDAVRWCL